MQTRRSLWSADEVVKLVAYLDYYVQKRSEMGKWPIEAVLSKLQTHLKPRSTEQIRRKLVWLWGGPDAASSKQTSNDVYKHGSRCLNRLSDALKSEVQNTLKAIELNEASEILNTPQRLRSGKERSISIERQRRTPIHSFSKRAPPLRRSSRTSWRDVLQGPAQAAGEETQRMFDELLLSASRRSPSGRECASGNVKMENTSIDRISNPDPKVLISVDMNTISNDTRLTIADSFDSSSDIESNGTTESRISNSLQMTERRLFRYDNIETVPTTEPAEFREILSTLPVTNTNDIHQLLCNLLEDNSYFRQKCLLLQKKHTDYARKILYLEEIESRLARNPEWLINSHMHDQEKLIRDLYKSLKDQSFLKPFLQLDVYHQKPIDHDKIRTAFGGIASAVCCLARVLESRCKFVTFPEPLSKSLNGLAKRSLGIDPWVLPRETTVPPTVSGVSTHLVILSLIGAAICEWVFSSELHCAAMLSTPLLESYRSHLKSLCGEQGLRNLDLAAHRSVVEDEDFRNVYLSQTATRLADKLFTTLSPLDISFKTPELIDDVKSELESVFFHALLIKYDLMLCKDKFDIIWPCANSVFDQSFMEMYPPNLSERTHPANHKILQVKLGIVPGLRCYPSDRKLVEDSAFLKAGEKRVGTSTVISNAIVSLM